MIKKGILLASALLFITPLCKANSIEFDISGGVHFPELTNDSTVNINDDLINSYITHAHHHNEPVFGVGASYVFDFLCPAPLSLGLGVKGYYAQFGTVEGIQHPFINVAPDFDTLNYSFKSENYSVMFEPRLIYSASRWQPYILGGVGIAWNRLYGYDESPTDTTLSAAPVPETFSNHTSSALAYEVGLGVQSVIFNSFNCKTSYILALDYRYMNFGKGQLGSFPAQTSDDRLTVHRLDTQAVMLTFKVSIT